MRGYAWRRAEGARFGDSGEATAASLRFFFRPSPLLPLVLIPYLSSIKRSIPGHLCPIQVRCAVWRKPLMLVKGEKQLLPGAHLPYPCTWTSVDPSITLLSYVGRVYFTDLCCYQAHCYSAPTCQECGMSVVLEDWVRRHFLGAFLELSL